MQTLENDYIKWKNDLKEVKEGAEFDFVIGDKKYAHGEHQAHRAWYDLTETNKTFPSFTWQDQKESVTEFQKWREEKWKDRKDLHWEDYKTEEAEVKNFAAYREKDLEKRDTLVYTDWQHVRKGSKMGELVQQFQEEKERDWVNKKMLDFSSWLDLLEDQELFDSLKE